MMKHITIFFTIFFFCSMHSLSQTKEESANLSNVRKGKIEFSDGTVSYFKNLQLSGQTVQYDDSHYGPQRIDLETINTISKSRKRIPELTLGCGVGMAAIGFIYGLAVDDVDPVIVAATTGSLGLLSGFVLGFFVTKYTVVYSSPALHIETGFGLNSQNIPQFSLVFTF